MIRPLTTRAEMLREIYRDKLETILKNKVFSIAPKSSNKTLIDPDYLKLKKHSQVTNPASYFKVMAPDGKTCRKSVFHTKKWSKEARLEKDVRSLEACDEVSSPFGIQLLSASKLAKNRVKANGSITIASAIRELTEPVAIEDQKVEELLSS